HTPLSLRPLLSQFARQVVVSDRAVPILGIGDHPPLHPFPTRRSSDLCVLPRHPLRLSRHLRPCMRRTAPLLSVGRCTPSSEPGRSEEHTSELQSRENLVCRLLLEKKNKPMHR